MFEKGSVTLDDFSGGFTDLYLKCSPNQSKTLTNLFLTADKKLIVRPGSTLLYGTTDGQLPSGSQFVTGLIDYDTGTALLHVSHREIFWYNTVLNTPFSGAIGWNTLIGPTSNPALSAGSASHSVSWAGWNAHIFVTTDSTSSNVMKIYADGTNPPILKVRNAGLPRLAETANYVSATEEANCVILANAIRASMLAHFANTDSHTVADTTSGVSIAAACTNLATALTLAGTLLNAYYAHYKDSITAISPYHVYGINNGQKNPILTPITQRLSTTNAPVTLVELAPILNDLKNVYNEHEGDVDTHIDNGQITSGPTIGANQVKIFLTNLASTNGTTNPSVITSATYSFVAGDVGKTLVITAGTNWTQASYTIVSVLAGAATLSAAVGTNATLSGGSGNFHANEIIELTTGPSITRNLTRIYAVVNGLKENINAHINDIGITVVGDSIDVGPTTNEFTVTSLLNGEDFTDFVNNTVVVSPGMPISQMDDGRHYRGTPLIAEVGSKAAGSAILVMNNSATTTEVGAIMYTDIHTSLSLYPMHYKATPVITAANATTPWTLVELLFDIRKKLATHITEAVEEGNQIYYHKNSPTLSTQALADLVDYRFLSFWLGGFTSANSFDPGEAPVRIPDYRNGFSDLQLNAIIAAIEEAVVIHNSHDSDTAAHGSNLLFQKHHQQVIEDIDFKAYKYAIHYQYEYTVGTLSFVDKGPITFIGEDSDILVSLVDNENILVQNIPAITNSTTGNYDTAVITVQIYRTLDTGTIFYKVGQVTNGTTTFTDNISDVDLVNSTTLYTTDGSVENDPPPIAKYLHTVNNILYYGNCKEGTEILKNRIRQSIQGDPDSVPGDFFVDLDDEVTGISSFNGKPIAFTSTSVYRLDGQFDFLGRGFIAGERLYKGDGCVSHNSIVQIKEGIVWAGNNGFYYSDGYNVIQINEDWTTTYKALDENAITAGKNKTLICGAYDPRDGRVWWGTSSNGVGSFSNTNNQCYVLDTRWGLTKNSTFSLVNNPPAGTFYGFTCHSIIFYDEIIRGSNHGHIYQHKDTAYLTDPRENTSGSLMPTWGGKALIYDWVSVASDLGDSKNRKWVPDMSFILKNTGGASVQINSINDDGLRTDALKVFRARGRTGYIEEKRWFAKGGLRCGYKQVEFTNGFVETFKSDDYATATRTTTTTITIDSGSWPTDPIDHFLYLIDDLYVTAYLITARTATVLTVIGSLPIGSGKKWIMKGYPKDERFNLQSITINYSARSNSQDTFKGNAEDVGGNA